MARRPANDDILTEVELELMHIVWALGGGTVRQVMLIGRYCDRFEKRGEEWRVAARTVVYDWVEEQSVPGGTEAERFGPRLPIGGSFPEDPVYQIGAGA